MEDVVQLPSRGKFYQGKLPKGEVKIRNLTSEEEAILLSPDQNRLRILDRVLERCLVSKEVPLMKLLSADRTFLLFRIRVLTHGVDFSATMRCPSCGNQFPTSLDLAKDLRLKMLDDQDREVEEITLPSGLDVGVRRLLVEDEHECYDYAMKHRQAKGNRRDVESDPGYQYRLAKHIATINGEQCNMLQAMQLFPMSAGDSQALQMAIEDFSCGLDLTLDLGCPSCGYRFEHDFQFSNEFFRPKSVRYVRRNRNPEAAGDADSGAAGTVQQ